MFGRLPLAIWGSRAGTRNRSAFDRMSPGDDVLIVEGPAIRLVGKVAAKVHSPDLSRALWQPLDGRAGDPWELVYFIANARQLDVPFAEFCRLFGYSPGYQLRGFASVDAARLEQFTAAYGGDLFAVLERLQSGVQPVRRPDFATPTPGMRELQLPEVDAVIDGNRTSDHVRMQWKLARLGLKAGERVWVPVGDQTRIRQAFDFNEFDPEFSAGIDLPHSYGENIDVVWKQQYRIGAAYEIENSTSIYSGLLRFADLNILAPNTLSRCSSSLRRAGRTGCASSSRGRRSSAWSSTRRFGFFPTKRSTTSTGSSRVRIPA